MATMHCGADKLSSYQTIRKHTCSAGQEGEPSTFRWSSFGGGVGRLSVVSQLALGRGPIKSNSDSESDPLTSRHLSVQESDAHLLFYVHLLQGLDEFAEGNAHVPVGVSLLNSPVSDAAQLII